MGDLQTDQGESLELSYVPAGEFDARPLASLVGEFGAPPLLMEKYLVAADKVVTQAFQSGEAKKDAPKSSTPPSYNPLAPRLASISAANEPAGPAPTISRSNSVIASIVTLGCRS